MRLMLGALVGVCAAAVVKRVWDRYWFEPLVDWPGCEGR